MDMRTPVLVLALAAVASAQVNPKPCDGPASFTARFKRFDKARRFYVEGRMFYDAANRRVRELEFESINNTRVAYDKLKIYSQNTEYTVDLKTRKCNVTLPRPREWRPYGVVPDALFVATGVVGLVGVPGEAVSVAIFRGSFSDSDSYFVTVTEPDCFPVEYSSKGENDFYHREFYDVVAGITDPEAFNVPQECQ